VGFKNGTSGDVQIAIEAVRSAVHPHTFLGHTKHGQSAIFVTLGNPDCHVILRGGRTTTNYDNASVTHASALLEANRKKWIDWVFGLGNFVHSVGRQWGARQCSHDRLPPTFILP